jgi:hypothetical protein
MQVFRNDELKIRWYLEAQGTGRLETHSSPVQALLIDQDPHELGYGEGGVSVVQLDGHLLRHRGEVSPRHLPEGMKCKIYCRKHMTINTNTKFTHNIKESGN